MRSLTVVLIFAGAVSLAAQVTKQERAGIVNFSRVDAVVACGGAPLGAAPKLVNVKAVLAIGRVVQDSPNFQAAGRFAKPGFTGHIARFGGALNNGFGHGGSGDRRLPRKQAACAEKSENQGRGESKDALENDFHPEFRQRCPFIVGISVGERSHSDVGGRSLNFVNLI